jgi:DNA adenine methylase
MHRSQMNNAGPAMSFSTCAADLPQKLQLPSGGCGGFFLFRPSQSRKPNASSRRAACGDVCSIKMARESRTYRMGAGVLKWQTSRSLESPHGPPRPLPDSSGVNFAIQTLLFWRAKNARATHGAMSVVQLRRPEAALRTSLPEDRVRAAPFLKWAGGKTSLLPELRRHVPARYRRYHEPFVGGGALFFAVAPRRALLSDSNGELVHCYLQVRDDVHGVLAALARHVYERTHYQNVRALEPHGLTAAERAARFIYLNKTCFNGLWRVNRAGRFNVPIGRYTNPRFYDPAALIAASNALGRTELLHASFEDAVARAAPGDFVYLDPPYDPVSATSSFASYTADGFTWDDQKRLSRACIALDRRGVRFLLSNSATERIRELYRGFEQRLVRAPRFINSKAASRGRVDELLVFNA